MCRDRPAGWGSAATSDWTSWSRSSRRGDRGIRRLDRRKPRGCATRRRWSSRWRADGACSAGRAIPVARRLRRRGGMAMLSDGGTYHFRSWPDDGETFEFRAVGENGEGVLVNLTNPGDGNNFWVRADGEIRSVAGVHVATVDDLARGAVVLPMGIPTRP